MSNDMRINSESYIHFNHTASIICLTYNSAEIISNCLDSLLSTNYPRDLLDIIVFDNSSDDNTVEIIEGKYTDIKLIKNSSNLGYSKGNN